MAIPSTVVGAVTEPVDHEVDARWLMAYAAGLGDHNARYLDTTAAAGIVGHPLFPVCPEWPAVLATRDLCLRLGTPREELRRGIHATHDVVLHRPVVPGDRLTTRARVTRVERRRPGAFVVARLTTTDAEGGAVAETWQGSLYLGVDLDGPGGTTGDPSDEPPTPPPGAPAAPGSTRRLELPAGAAHVYTECARIWNPIHTDPRAAQAAGLERIILHGTATLALAVTSAVDVHAGGDPTRVERIRARFAAMVPLPSPLDVATGDRGDGVVDLSVTTAAGEAALRDAFVTIR